MFYELNSPQNPLFLVKTFSRFKPWTIDIRWESSSRYSQTESQTESILRNAVTGFCLNSDPEIPLSESTRHKTGQLLLLLRKLTCFCIIRPFIAALIYFLVDTALFKNSGYCWKKFIKSSTYPVPILFSSNVTFSIVYKSKDNTVS